MDTTISGQGQGQARRPTTHQASVNESRQDGIRRRLIAVTASGPIYHQEVSLAVIPFTSGLALLQELATRIRNEKVEVASSLALRVRGRNAYLTWLYHTARIGMGLASVPPRWRIVFLRALIDYIHRKGDVGGLEPLMAATLNATWPWMSAQRTSAVTKIFHSQILRSKFIQETPALVCDPITRNITMLPPGELAKADVDSWLDWRNAVAGNWGTQGMDASDLGMSIPRGPDWGDVLSGNSGWGGWGVPSGPGRVGPGGGPNGLGGFGGFGRGQGNGSGSSAFGNTGWGRGIGSNGFGDTGFDGNGNGGSGIDWTQPGSGAGVFGAGFGSGLGRGMGPSGLGGFGQPGNGVGPGGLFSGGEPGSGGFNGLGVLGGLGPIDFNAPGGPFGTGAYLGNGGASDFWGDAAQVVGKTVQGAGAVATAVGGGLIVAGAAQDATIVLGVTGTGFMITGAEVVVGGLGAGFVGLSIEQWGKTHNEGEKPAEKAPDAQAAPPVITVPTVEIDDSEEDDEPKPKDSKPGDLYPDPDGGGSPSPNRLPAGDGIGGGRPDSIWDDQFGGGRPNSIWDENGGGGRPTSIWDENGGGGRPNSIAGAAKATFFSGAGLRAAIVQVGPSTFRF
ncbi:hypothetical protein [Burkholderia sp. 572]|uniref:hypothetical protein n=1 Tax=Burkholderia sp. 572 TaxID=3156414 RepID=UPI0033927182